jgi:Family of unknown function (DUF6499)
MGQMQVQAQWSTGDAYTYLDDLGSKAFAWELLRRNSEYRAAYRSIASEGDAASVARRWGCAVDPDLRANRALVESLNIA